MISDWTGSSLKCLLILNEQLRSDSYKFLIKILIFMFVLRKVFLELLSPLQSLSVVRGIWSHLSCALLSWRMVGCLVSMSMLF